MSSDVCKCCGQRLPVTPRPPASLSWDDLWQSERRLLVGAYLDHVNPKGRGEYADWRMLELAPVSYMTYRGVSNALWRLVESGWFARIDRGVYRLTPAAVAHLRATLPKHTKVGDYRPGTRPRK